MKTITIFPLALLLMYISCGNKAKTENKNALNCNDFFLKFKELYISEKKDSALFYIDKAIDCDKTKNNYKSAKLNFLISISSYNEAIYFLDRTDSFLDNNSLNILKGVLNLKIHNIEEGNINLKKVFDNYKNMSKLEVNELFYFIALLNYFDNNDKAIEKLNQVEKEYPLNSYEGQNFLALKKNISENQKEIVLYNLFNIKE